MTTRNLTRDDSLLRTAMRANAAFSIVSGVFLAVAAGIIAEFLGIAETTIFDWFNGDTFIRLTGIGLIPYAFLLYTITRQAVIEPIQGMGAVAGDFAWIIASIVLLIMDWLPLTTAGSWAILIVAEIVLVFGIIQFVGVRRIQKQV